MPAVIRIISFQITCGDPKLGAAAATYKEDSMKTPLKHVLFLTILLVLAVGTAQAADIIVDESTCTLVDAITSANTDTTTGGCPAGSGDDTITLKKDVLLTAKLPDITSAVIIEGEGHKIDGQNDEALGSMLTVVSYGGALTLNNVTVTGGKTAHGGAGGGISNSGILILNNSTVSGNSAYWGGGICNTDGGTVTLTNSTVSENSAYCGGGIINYYNGHNSYISTVILNNSTISGNSADFVGAGGGVLNESQFIVNNSTVSENSAGEGGGIINYGTVNLISSTVSGNTALSGNSGGIYNDDQSFDENSPVIILNRSIVSGNNSNDIGKELYCDASGTITANSVNLLGHSGETNANAFFGFTPGASDINATSDGTNTALSAILSPLASNGGPTKTHALPAGSPAIDLDPACGTGFGTDQRGYPRPVGAGCDTGSFEFGVNNPSMMPVYLLLLLK